MAAWNLLSEDLRESNRRQAEHIGSKLQRAGCTITPRTDWDEPLFQFTSEEVEALARTEHERFVAERESHGWSDGPIQDARRKISPNLVPWANMDEHSRELDRSAVRHIPVLLAKVGFKVQRR